MAREPKPEQSTTGKVKEKVGWATGDRDVEAEGRADTTPDEDPNAVKHAKDDVREDHGDTDGYSTE